MKLPLCICYHCEYVWKRPDETAEHCPRCYSLKWDTPPPPGHMKSIPYALERMVDGIRMLAGRLGSLEWQQFYTHNMIATGKTAVDQQKQLNDLAFLLPPEDRQLLQQTSPEVFKKPAKSPAIYEKAE